MDQITYPADKIEAAVKRSIQAFPLSDQRHELTSFTSHRLGDYANENARAGLHPAEVTEAQVHRLVLGVPGYLTGLVSVIPPRSVPDLLTLLSTEFAIMEAELAGEVIEVPELIPEGMVRQFCQQCGQAYQTPRPDHSRYCGDTCRKAALRAKARAKASRMQSSGVPAAAS